jgi:hypothetical protein
MTLFRLNDTVALLFSAHGRETGIERELQLEFNQHLDALKDKRNIEFSTCETYDHSLEVPVLFVYYVVASSEWREKSVHGYSS